MKGLLSLIQSIKERRFSCGKIIFFIFVFVSVLPFGLSAQTYSSIASGDWDAASTWKSTWANIPPSGNQTMIINSGNIVTCNHIFSGITDITINGTLIVNGDFSANNITVGPTGVLIIKKNFTGGALTVAGQMTVSGSFSSGNNTTVTSTGSLGIGGDYNPTGGFDISGTVDVEGAFSLKGGGSNIVENGGCLLVKGNSEITITDNFTVNGKVLISGSVFQQGGNIDINQSGLFVVGQNLSIGPQQFHLNGSSSKLLVQGNMTTSGDGLKIVSGAQIAVLGDLNITNWNKSIFGCTTPNYTKPSEGCTSCQILDTVDPTNPDWQISNGITALWWEDFNDNSNGSERENSKWQAIGNSDGYRTTVVANKQLQSTEIPNKSDSPTEVWKSAVIDISCYQNVNISSYTYGSASINNLYYRINGTGDWQQIPRDGTTGYNRKTGLVGNTLQLSWWVSGDASTCSLDNVGVYGTAIADCSSGSPLCLMTNQQDASCEGKADGSATVSATGGTGSYTYSWSPSGGISTIASGLLAGDYSVTVVSGSQTATVSVTIKALHLQVTTGAVSRE